MRLKIVKEETEYPSTDRDEESDVMLHGVKMLKQLISSWSRSERFVCVDFYFTPVQAAEVMDKEGLKFIRIVKTTTRIPIKLRKQLNYKRGGIE